MRLKQLIVGATLLACLLAGCSAVPMNYVQWKKEQEDRKKFQEAGLPYKSPAELRAEAAEMRRAAQDTSFTPDAK